MQPLVIFGTGRIAEVVADHAERANYKVVAFTVERQWIRSETFLGLPAIPFESISESFSPATHHMHVAIGYHQLNRVRERICSESLAKGYSLASIVSVDAWVGSGTHYGQNCFISSGAVMETGSRIGCGVYLWSNVVVGHHSTIEDHAWIAAGTVIGGGSTIGARNFLALNCTVGNEVQTGKDCLLGARTLTTKSLPPGSVVVDRDSEILRLNSEQFLRISKLK